MSDTREQPAGQTQAAGDVAPPPRRTRRSDGPSRQWPAFLFIALLVVAVPLLGAEYYVAVMTIAGLWSLHAVGMTLLLGGSGELNLAYGSFFGIGAYACALLVERGLPFLLALLAAMALGGVVTLLVGMPLLRTRALFYAIVTLSFAIVAADVFNEWTDVTGGSVGLPVPLVDLSWVAIPTGGVHAPSVQIYGLVWACVIGVAALVRRLLDSPYGRVLRGIGGDERLVEGLGFRPAPFRLSALVFTGVVAGLAGGLYGVFIGYLTPGPFTFWTSFSVVIMVIVGGRESVYGSLAAAVGLTVLPEVLRSAQSLRLIAYTLVLYGVIVWRRKHIVGGLAH